ncbi:MAG: NuoM family protein [Phycisphaerae bacterium]
MNQSSLLSWIVFLPLIGMLVVLCLRDGGAIKRAAIGFSAATFVLSLLLLGPFLFGDAATATREYGKLYFEQRHTWFSAGTSFKVEYFLGIDGLSMPLVLLTTFICMLAVAASWNFESWKLSRGLKGYMAMLLLLETGMLGVFVALDFFLFYIFWEVMLLPMYFLIGVWGGPRREYAAIKFFLYTLAGSVLMLVAMLAMHFYPAADVRTFDLIKLATEPAIQSTFRAATFLGWPFATTMFILLFIGFAIKMPIFPFHTWLPDAHVEAPTPVSMILAGVLLKMGGYGMLRICYPILPGAGETLAVALGTLGVINILYGALCTIAQDDFKKLVAYSSISHMGYVLLGMSAMNDVGYAAAMFQMIAHGISSPMCFFLVGLIYERLHHRDINRFGGLWLRMPMYGSLATIGFFASLGLPALCGFIGEVLAIFAAFTSPVLKASGYSHVLGIAAAFGAVLAAAYVLWMIQRVYLGAAREDQADLQDADRRELAILAPLAALCVLLGILPQQTVLNFINATMGAIAGLAK